MDIRDSDLRFGCGHGGAYNATLDACVCDDGWNQTLDFAVFTSDISTLPCFENRVAITVINGFLYLGATLGLVYQGVLCCYTERTSLLYLMIVSALLGNIFAFQKIFFPDTAIFGAQFAYTFYVLGALGFGSLASLGFEQKYIKYMSHALKIFGGATLFTKTREQLQNFWRVWDIVAMIIGSCAVFIEDDLTKRSVFRAVFISIVIRYIYHSYIIWVMYRHFLRDVQSVIENRDSGTMTPDADYTEKLRLMVRASKHMRIGLFISTIAIAIGFSPPIFSDRAWLWAPYVVPITAMVAFTGVFYVSMVQELYRRTSSLSGSGTGKNTKTEGTKNNVEVSNSNLHTHIETSTEGESHSFMVIPGTNGRITNSL